MKSVMSHLRYMIGPSILNSDLAKLSDECHRLLDAGADYLHLDVMDGHFVPNITFGHPVVKCLRKHIPRSSTMFDLHMMVEKPERWIEPMADAGADLFTFHLEAADNPDQIIRKIRDANMKAGMAIKPGTSVETVFDWIDHVDMILIMTVEPGFGGQKFMEDMMEKVRRVRQKHSKVDIEVDGGVGPANIGTCVQAGANMLVSGTAITGSKDPKATMDEMRRCFV